MNRARSTKAGVPWLVGIGSAAATLLLLLLTNRAIGVTWDEPVYNTTAEAAARWLGLIARGELSQAFDPFTFGVSWGLANEHPPLMRMVNGLGWALTRDLLPVPTSHRFGGLVLAALAIGTLVTAQARLHGLAVGLFTGAILLTMPRVFFHAHLAALDFPLAALWLLATLGFYTATTNPRWWSPLMMGTGLGLALLTKINAVLLIPYWALWLFVFRRERRAFVVFLLSLVIGLLVLVAGWPWIWKDPLGGLVNWVRFFQVHFDIGQWFAGSFYVKTPWYAPFLITAITVPIGALALAVFGTGHGWWRFLRGKAPGRGGTEDGGGAIDRARHPLEYDALHLFGLLITLGYYALPVTSLHDQERLLLPAFVHLAALAGRGFAALLSWVRHHMAWPVLAGLFLAPGIIGIVQTHPFELCYYNALTGGPAGARRLGMETIYFASTYSYFLPELNRLPTGSALWVVPNSWDVLYYYQIHGLLRRDLVLLRPPGWGSFYDGLGVPHAVGGINDADYALIERRQTGFAKAVASGAVAWIAGKPEIARLERAGVVLATLHSAE